MPDVTGKVMRTRRTKTIEGLLMFVAGAATLYPGFSRPTPVNAMVNITYRASSQDADTGASASLDFNAYRARIEPIFLKKRQGHVRCYDCHSVMSTRLRLQPLAAGESTWTEEQSRLNFEVVSRLVTRHDPMESRLLLHPLALEAGGD